MAKYTLIASRDPIESREAEKYCTLAGDLVRSGNEVTLFLVQNGVFGARKGAMTNTLASLSGAGVAVLADSFSLRERGIAAQGLAAGIRAAELDVVVDHMAAGHKVLWN